MRDDVQGNPIVNSQGKAVPVLVFEDNDGGAANCGYDAGEERLAENAVPGVNWGVTPAPPAGPPQSPEDTGGGDYSTGSSFTQPDGSDAAWVSFGPTASRSPSTPRATSASPVPAPARSTSRTAPATTPSC